MTGCILTGYPTVKGEEIEVAESAVSSIDLSTRVLVAEPEPDLKDIPYVQVAKEIVNRTLDQRIIFTTTLPSDRVRQDIDSMGIKDNKNEILTKPFRFSKLLSLICRSIKS